MTHNSRNSANENVSNHINVVQKRNDDEYANEIGAVNIELPIIITSSASCCSDTDLLPQAHSSITFRRETTLMSCDDNNVDQLTVMRTPSANNLNSSSASRGNVRRWSQSLSSGAKAKQQKAIKAKKPINCMPSRLQKLPTALSLDGRFTGIGSLERNIDQFASEIEQHDYLLEDSPTGQHHRNSILRALPQSLTMKRKIKSKVELTVQTKSHHIRLNRWKRAMHNIGQFNYQMKAIIRKAIVNGELCYKSMKEIEAHFGGGVGTYFKFLRFLFLLNLLSMVTVLCFIVLPQILKNCLSSEHRATILLTSTYQALTNPMDYITAEGHLENSILFYGSYSTESKDGSIYSLPYAYLMTMICIYVITFIVLSVSLAKSYRKSFIESSDGESMTAHKVFCSWDYRVTDEKAVATNKQIIHNELKLILDGVYDSVDIQTKWICFWIWVTQISANVFVFGILGGVGYFIWSLLHTTMNMESNSSLIVPTIVVFMMLGLQILFEWLATLESYKSPRVTLNISLVRNYLLEMVIIAPLFVFWLSKSHKGQCWETAIGQEIYRFVIIDFLLVGCVGALYHLIRFALCKYVWPQIGLPEFSISRSSLGLIFNQTLLWIGLFFSPILGAILIIKMILIFYLRKFVLIYFCKPPSKLWRSAQTSTIFLAMTFVSLMVAIVALGYVLTQVHVSDTCGPFRNHEFMYQVFRGDILKIQENHVLWRLILLLVRPASIGGFILTLCVIVYYLRSKSKARIAMVKMLKNMLVIEAKDKQYLLKRITRETKGKDWLFEEVNKNNNTIPRRLNGGLESYAEFYYEKRRNGELDSSTSSNSTGLSMKFDMLRQRRKS